MSEGLDHVRDEMHALLDGRLDADARAGVEAHLARCGACRAEWEALQRIRDGVRTAVRRTDLPADLAVRIDAALNAEDAIADAARARTRRRRWAIVTAGAAAAAALLVVLLGPRGQDLPAAVARDYERYRRGTLELQIQSASADAIQAFFSKRVTFPPRVFDLGMMSYELVGGRVHDLSGRPSALFVYRGPAQQVVVCQMYPGRPQELPAGAEIRERDGISFSIYRREGRTLVFWQEGDVTCVLTSDMPGEDVIQLAFAKAMKV